jgi:hypothetical protein
MERTSKAGHDGQRRKRSKRRLGKGKEASSASSLLASLGSVLDDLLGVLNTLIGTRGQGCVK